jgi:putative SOS response-associated peptidase YedK
MCGRYRLSRRKEVLAEQFDTNFDDLDWEPRYNIAPTQAVPVIRQTANIQGRQAAMMRWGLIPSWSTNPNVGARTINARAETVGTKPSFLDPLRKQRCLVPADAFYEWRRSAKQKQPFCFEVDDGALFAFAGLWDSWRAPDGRFLESCTILTTMPNDLLAGLHDRMPVILPVEDHERWLDPSMRDIPSAISMLGPYDSTRMRRYPIGSRVNLVTNDDPGCSAPVDLPVATGSLFD